MSTRCALVWQIVKCGFPSGFLNSQKAIVSAVRTGNYHYLSSTACVVDLRSDTITKPTPMMREAMKNAVVGDDVYREDPTVIKLEETVADVLGKEAALIVPTCTMANTVSVLVHCNGRFNEVILGEESHMNLYEVAGMAQLAGVQGCCVPNLADGTMDLDRIESKIRPLDDDHEPLTRVVCVENTHNRCGGKVLSLEYMRKVSELASKHKLISHLDGARIFNAATALKVPVSDIAQYFDTVAVAFSKALCCPVGSVVAGSKSFVDLARKARKCLGGGMRQAGVLAAPMLVALEHMVPRLWEDHDRAFRIAKAIDDMQASTVCSVSLDGVQSNIVMIDFHGSITPAQFSHRLREVSDKERSSLEHPVSVLMTPYSSTKLRYVTHNDVNDDDVDKAIDKLEYVIEEFSHL